MLVTFEESTALQRGFLECKSMVADAMTFKSWNVAALCIMIISMLTIVLIS